MDEPNVASPVPGWFTVAAIAALLWELLGCALYLMRVTVDPATLPADQLPIYQATPQWVLIAFAVAVWVGLVGAILLLMRRRQAEPLLLVSLLALVVQNSVYLIDSEMRNLVASDQLLVPFVILIVCYGIWMLSRRARKAGWLH